MRGPRLSVIALLGALLVTFASAVTASASSGPTLVKTIFPGGGSADPGEFIRLSSSTALFRRTTARTASSSGRPTERAPAPAW